MTRKPPKLVLVALLASMVSAFFLGYLPAHLLSPYHFDLHHDGLTLFDLQSYEKDFIPYKEFFIQHGLATIQIQSIVAKLFGQELIFLREFTALCYGLLVALTFLIAKKLTSNSIALLVAALWSGSAYYLSPFLPFYIHSWSSVYALVCLLLIIYIYVSEKRVKNFKLVIIGVLISFSGLFKINYGVVSLLCSFIIINNISQNLQECCKNLLLISIGSIIILLPYLCYLYDLDAIKEFYDQQIRYAFIFSNNNSDKINLLKFFYNFIKIEFSWNNGHGGVSALNYIAGYIFIIVTIWQLFINKKIIYKNSKLFSIGLCGLICNFLYFPVPSLMHIFLSGPLLLIYVSGLLSDELINKFFKLLSFSFITIYIIWEVLFNHIYKFYKLKIPLYSEYSRAPDLPYLKNILVSPEMVDHLNAISKIYSNAKDQKISCYLNITPQPYYSVLFAPMIPSIGGVMPFDWGYVNNIVGDKKIKNFCTEGQLLVSSMPYLYDGYSLDIQLKNINAQDFSTPITSYVSAGNISKLNVHSSIFIKSIEKSLSKKLPNPLTQSVEHYGEHYGIEFKLDGLNIAHSKKITGVYLEMLNSPIQCGLNLIEQSNAYKSSEPLMFSTNPVAPTGILFVYSDSKIVSPALISSEGILLPATLNKLTVVPNTSFIYDDLPLFYKLRVQFEDRSISEAFGQLNY